MPEKIMPFEPGVFLDSVETIAAYLEQANKEGDPRMFRLALGTVAKARGMSKLASDLKVTREGLYKAFSAEGNPSFDLVSRTADVLGVRMVFALKEQPIKKPKRDPIARNALKGSSTSALIASRRVSRKVSAKKTPVRRLRGAAR